MIDALSSKITCLIRDTNSQITDEKAEIVNYGLNILIYQILVSILVFTLAIIFNVINYVFVCVMIYGVLRVFAEGAHARNRIQCAFSYTLIIFATVFAAKHMWAESFYPSLLIAFISLFITYIYAPGDTVEKPILSKRIKRRKRTISLFLVLFVFLISLVVWHFDRVLYNVIIITPVWVMFLLTPAGYRLFSCKHSYEEGLNVQNKE